MSAEDFSSWDILDETNQLIQISDLTFHMKYANRPARTFSLNTERPFAGEKCYRYMMNLEEQCPFCPLRQMQDRTEFITEIDGAFVAVTASIGAIYADIPAAEALSLLNLSDKALYQSKKNGRNRYTLQRLSEL